MDKKIIFILLGILIIVGLAGAILITMKPKTLPSPSTIQTPETETPPESTTESPTTEEKRITEKEEIKEGTKQAKFSSCVILDEEYCDKGIVIKKYGWARVGFNIPGANVYSPMDGVLQLTYFHDPMGEGYSVFLLGTPENPIVMVFENMILHPDLQEEIEKGSPRVSVIEFPQEIRKTIEVRKGELIGKISDKFYEEGYNFGIFFPKEETAAQYFPYVK